jgi:acyl carrier protein
MSPERSFKSREGSDYEHANWTGSRMSSQADWAASEEVALRVRTLTAENLELDLEDVQMESSFFDLGAESLDLLDVAFALESEYKISFPRTDILERATEHFGEDALVKDGLVTDLGLQLLREGMPELDRDLIKPGLLDTDVAQNITVGSFARITQRLIDAKAAFPRTCPDCGGTLVESEAMPEFECSSCGKIVPVPSGDEILMQDLIDLHQQTVAEQ